MYAVKSELCVRESVCCGCLSSDRIVTVIGEHQGLFSLLLGNTKPIKDLDFCNKQLCWECKSTLLRINKFQQKITQAQYILESSLHLGENDFLNSELSNSLSVLSITFNSDYDYIIEHDENKPIPEPILETLPTSETQLLEVIQEVKVEQYHSFDNSACDDVNDSQSDSDKGTDKKKQMLGKFERKAIVSKIPLDLNKPEKYFKEVWLSNKELDDVLDREWRRSKRAKSQYRYSCSRCNMQFKRSVDMKRHNDCVHLKNSPPFKCSECKYVCSSREDLEKHWEKHNNVFKCTFCYNICRAGFEMNHHLVNKHTRLYTCKLCGVQISSSHDFTVHYKENHTKFVCDDCGREFNKKKVLEKHIVKTHLPPFCHECNRHFPKYHSLEVHYRNYHPELIYKSVKPDQSYCVECNRQFRSQYLYKRHLSTAIAHVQKKTVKVPCPDCGKVFSRKAYMKNHYKLVHVRSSSHFCEICNKQFVSGFSLRTHTKFVHQKSARPKDKICEICGRGFHTNRTLINHKRTHTGERPYKCTYCPAAFAQCYARKTHERTQHKNFTDNFILPV